MSTVDCALRIDVAQNGLPGTACHVTQNAQPRTRCHVTQNAQQIFREMKHGQ